MGQLAALITGRAVAFDTAPLIYYLEEHPTYLSLVDELFDAIDAGNANGMTSVLTLLEVLVKPLRDGRSQIADEYRQLLTASSNLKLHAIDEAVCQRAASLRASHAWLRTPDALQLGTALEHQAEVIVTNDEHWKALSEIKVIVLKDYVTVT
jgi:predicted nucleic acid-binding protein